MSDRIEILFKGERKELFSNPMQFPFKPGDYAIVQADKGEDLGLVNQLGPAIQLKKVDGPLKEIIRKPNARDLVRLSENRQKEEEGFVVCREKIKKSGLPMKLVDVEFQFDGNKITFYFTAEKRVDFRELVKDLAGHYRVRIELRQIGVRDEAKRISGYGVCGRRLCCSTWLSEFEPITTQCAKEQNLPLNPQKLSGVCGRLMCCLSYERCFYIEELKKYPEVNTPVNTPKGTGFVDKIDVFKEEVYLKYPSSELIKFTLIEVNRMLHKKHSSTQQD
ncbi:stage 0 sporulation family protein [candidate division KSB1 bacterium]|nr:stage 0 sporulation family protein [candidate division KSB1 bacterium]